MFRRESSINQAYYLAHSLYFHNNLDYDNNFLNLLNNVTVNDVKTVAQKYMKIESPVSVVVH